MSEPESEWKKGDSSAGSKESTESDSPRSLTPQGKEELQQMLPPPRSSSLTADVSFAEGPYATASNSTPAPLVLQKTNGRTPSSHFVSSPLNPSSPASHSRPASRGSAYLNRAVSEEPRSLLSNSPPALNSQSSKGSMVLYRLASEDLLLGQPLAPPKLAYNRDSVISSSGDSYVSISGDSKYPSGFNTIGKGLVPYAYDPTLDEDDPPDEEDVLHDPRSDKYDDQNSVSTRGVLNVGVLILLIAGLLCLFVFYPVISHFKNNARYLAIDGNTRINATGQATDDDPTTSSALTASTTTPTASTASTASTTSTSTTDGVVTPTDTSLADPTTVQKRSVGMFSSVFIDRDTPELARHRTGFDGMEYELVFSDEFNVPGRSFLPGDDPSWEAVNLPSMSLVHDDEEEDQAEYASEQVTTRDGHLVLRMDRTEKEGEMPSFRSGMLQSWNKFCFSGGYVEVSLVLPGDHSRSRGYLPKAWTLGNLARAGFPATLDGVWPYSYNECDSSTRSEYSCGQRLSACTCPGEDHPGPASSKGRGAPEIDIIRAHQGAGHALSQSVVVSPFSKDYLQRNQSEDEVRVYDDKKTSSFVKRGNAMQQSVLGMTRLPEDVFQGSGKNFTSLGFEYWTDPETPEDGYIIWQSGGERTMRIGAGALVGDGDGEVGQRLIAEEPMSIVFNLGVSTELELVDLASMRSSTEMWVDYVRVYQRRGQVNVGCSPEEYPTAEYIERHYEQYSDPKLKKWNKKRPRNRLHDGGC